jgi:hypothetical protein
MIVSELIEQLTKLPQDALVLARGYESGYNSIKSVGNLIVLKRTNNDWYDGEYSHEDNDFCKTEPTKIQAVFLSESVER